MNATRVLVLGSTGMLGRSVGDELLNQGFSVVSASRSKGLLFDAEADSLESLIGNSGLNAGGFVVNCIGLTKSHIQRKNTTSIERAIRLNVLFPIELARAAERFNFRVIQVATNCVFSGQTGHYSETSPHDAGDEYGKTKSLGEVASSRVMHLRCSLVGPEGEGRRTLFFEWVRNAAPNSLIEGYVNHRWNGITSLAFARIVSGIIANDGFIAGVHHIQPADQVTKFDLVSLVLELLGRTDVHVRPAEASPAIDRTLISNSENRNSIFFANAGYERIPTIREMMEELPWESLREGRI